MPHSGRYHVTLDIDPADAAIIKVGDEIARFNPKRNTIYLVSHILKTS